MVFGDMVPSYDGLININILYDKRKELAKAIAALVERRDTVLLEQVSTMREGLGFGDLAL